MKRVPALLLAVLGVAACGGEKPASPSTPPVVVVSDLDSIRRTPKVPEWAKVAPEQIAEAKKHGVPVAFENDLGMRFVLIPAGTFVMGSPESERGHVEGGSPQHSVSVPSFYMATTEVTAGQFARFREESTAEYTEREGFASATHEDARAFAGWLSSRSQDRAYRLPSEAEWEYACRALTIGPYSVGATLPSDRAAIQGAAGVYLVGSYPPNAWGLHDMHGGLWEMCADSWHGTYHGAPADGTAWAREDGGEYVIRGGSTQEDGLYARSAVRWRQSAGMSGGCIGFRLVSPLPER